MDAKEAVAISKLHAADVFEGEMVRIEEMWFVDTEKPWCVTIGLQRVEPMDPFDVMAPKRALTRVHYKTVRIDETTQSIKSVCNHVKRMAALPCFIPSGPSAALAAN